jgi:soluble lytic murein transglycosylase-like protein
MPPLATLALLLTPAAASAAFAHVVTPGESLNSVAAADGLTVAQLAAANGLSSAAQLVAGRTLQIPPRGSTVGPTGATSGGDGDGGADDHVVVRSGDGDGDSDDVSTGSPVITPATTRVSSGAYVVQIGDTLSAIAARAGTSVAALAATNGIDPAAPLRAGSVVRLSRTVTLPTMAASQPVGTAAEGSAAAPPYPTAERVTAGEVGSIAAANGVPPSLADAIAWQESGFNNGLVSSADARGVMQILPGTWDWIQRSLSAGAPLASASAADNVRGGVLLLRSLLSSTGGDPALAAAGYYQGLPSVRHSGLFPSTQRYVNSVLALKRKFGGG